MELRKWLTYYTLSDLHILYQDCYIINKDTFDIHTFSYSNFEDYSPKARQKYQVKHRPLYMSRPVYVFPEFNNEPILLVKKVSIPSPYKYRWGISRQHLHMYLPSINIIKITGQYTSSVIREILKSYFTEDKTIERNNWIMINNEYAFDKTTNNIYYLSNYIGKRKELKLKSFWKLSKPKQLQEELYELIG